MLPISKKLTPYNYNTIQNKKNKFIVIHYVGAVSTAKNNADYYASNKLKSSAHYFVDQTSIWQSVKDEDISWHCGGGLQGSNGHTFYKICTNSNSIGIEMCVKKKNGVWYFEPETVTNTIELVKYLMKKHNIPISNVIRHYDVTGKNCPEPYVSNPSAWNEFKNRLVNNEEEIDMEELNKLKEIIADLQEDLTDHIKVYNLIEECPEWARQTISKLQKNGYLKGDQNGNLGLTYSDCRILTILDRAEAFKE